ncbi:MAG: DNA gyrase inhibitor YacG [Acidobacteria bacterium]|nr:DNA gyrase inhibitor YacG [Acidobacteriota bacterium]
MKSPELKAKCPICRRLVPAGEPDFPFCSARCREVDLGKWATEEYRIPGEPVYLSDTERLRLDDGE